MVSLRKLTNSIVDSEYVEFNLDLTLVLIT